LDTLAAEVEDGGAGASPASPYYKSAMFSTQVLLSSFVVKVVINDVA